MFNRIATFLLVFLLFLSGCKRNEPTQVHLVVSNVPPPITSTTQVMGYNLLSKICGIWDGGVVSETALGSYPEWIVDFRPYSAGQVGAKNELDTANNIFMSFFICYHDSAYKLAFRNGGSFTGLQRVSYMEIDSVSETSTQSFYRFADFVKGLKRTIVDVTFKQDSLIILAYTNIFNTEPLPTPHMQWRAKLQDTTSCQAAIAHFNFPQKVMVKDLSSAFAGDSESIFYQDAGDPYPASAQPYVGQTTIEYASDFALPAGHPVFLLITTQPLISNFQFVTANMIYRSRYVILAPAAPAQRLFNFTLMHPGTYYVYAYYDANGDGILDSGDYVSTSNTSFTLAPGGTATAAANMDYQIP